MTGLAPGFWELDLKNRNKPPRPVLRDTTPYLSVSASADGRHVVVTAAETPEVGLWTVPVHLGQVSTENDVKPILIKADRPHAPRFVVNNGTGKIMYFLSAHATVDGLWRWEDGKPSEVNGLNVPLFEPPAISHDGNRIVVAIRKDGKRWLRIMAKDGTDQRDLDLPVPGTAGQAVADWDPNNKWIVAGGIDSDGKRRLYRYPANGGKRDPLNSDVATSPVVSPDGDLIVYSGKFFKGHCQLQFLSRNGKSVDHLTQYPVRPGCYRFLPDGKGLVFIPVIQGPTNFWLLNLEKGKDPIKLTNLNKGVIQNFDVVMLDGQLTIVFDRTHEISNIAMIEIPKEPASFWG